MSFELPTTVSKPTITEPRFMLIYSSPKVGKSSSLMQLPKSLLIDLESGSGFYEGTALDIPKMSVELNKHPIVLLKELAIKIEEANKQNGSPIYDFITIDSATILEEYANLLATKNYKNSTIGKNFTGKNVVNELPQGSGFVWSREAFEELYTPFTKLAGKCFILVVHTKDAVINKNGKDINTSDLNLTGKSKIITSSKADGIALMYRSKVEGENILSFKGSETDITIGCRLPYLSQKEFIISKKENDKLTTNWNLIFPSITKNN